MSFASSTSAFGMKPAMSSFGQPNTTNTQTSIFGNASQPTTGSQPQAPAQGMSLFGNTFGQSTNQQQQQPQSNQGTWGLGQSQQQPQQQTTSLFGQPSTNNQSTNIFGQPAANNQPTNLFGQPSANTQQPAPTASLFGQPANSQQRSTSGTPLFGSTQAQQSTVPQQTGGFGLSGGNNNNSSTLGQSITTGGWGAPATQQQQLSNTFGVSTLGAPSTAGSLFGRPPQQPSFSTNQPPGPPPFTRSSKFNDLPDDIKRTLETLDTAIQGRVQISNELKQRKLGEEAIKGQEGVRAVHKDLVNTITTLHSDVLHMRDLKTKVEQTVQDTIVATRIVDGFRNPQQNGVYLKNHANFPLEFFTRVTQQLHERLRWYKTTIEQIERKLSSAAAQSQYTPQAITSTLEAQHATFIALASKTAALDAELQKIKALYTQLWRTRTGSMRDPFFELDRSVGDFGLDSLNSK
ncbi:hypothetical protein WOLCODRAFT_137683 [Wolfiporia cocos MD-104 SS10]|uniref:Nucleoporin Nup54 alpha-helical domain-containing protein n=1 Tax=Wolfiporia cocos (strain MD-104) TaxID=742152 RepID=A0A2H3JIS0_WOLCO|nr:hypothetical protein WOLCODRAFT_137683 [Wolfiporia cocos MD-104 SS10]